MPTRKNFPNAQARRVKEAEARAAESKDLTPQQRLARLDSLKLEAKKERAKLQARIDKGA